MAAQHSIDRQLALRNLCKPIANHQLLMAPSCTLVASSKDGSVWCRPDGQISTFLLIESTDIAIVQSAPKGKVTVQQRY